MKATVEFRGSRRVVAVALLCVSIVVGGCAGPAAPTPPGCTQLAAGSIEESKDFTPYELMKTKPVDAIIGGGQSTAVPDRVTIGRDSVAGLPRKHTVDASNGAVYSYFLDREIGESKRSDFFKRGGIELDQEPDDGSGSFASFLLGELGDRATSVTLGEYAAALTWGDPDAAGVRVHGVYWFDGKNNYSLMADRPAEALVNIGRVLVCG